MVSKETVVEANGGALEAGQLVFQPRCHGRLHPLARVKDVSSSVDGDQVVVDDGQESRIFWLGLEHTVVDCKSLPLTPQQLQTVSLLYPVI